MKKLSHRPEILFVLRNMNDTDPKNVATSALSIKKELEEVAKVNKVDLKSCLSFNESESLILMRNAFNDNIVYGKNSQKIFL